MSLHFVLVRRVSDNAFIIVGCDRGVFCVLHENRRSGCRGVDVVQLLKQEAFTTLSSRRDTHKE